MNARLPLVAYTIECAFIHDDTTDNALDEEGKDNNMLFQSLDQNGSATISSVITESGRRKSEVQAKIAAEFLRLDPVFAGRLMSHWKKYTQILKMFEVMGTSRL
ncbi:hypothetical protein N7540_004550 [Penicillium herquei]|nr:hypothetical protein N7540_004550 [Penicillium herquei]